MGFHLKKKAVWILSVFMITLFASCSKTQTPTGVNSTIEPKEITLTFMSNWGGSSAYRDLVEECINDFENENSGIKVMNESLSQEDYLAKLKTNFATGYIPDIFTLWPGMDLSVLINSGQVANLESIMTPEWKKSFSYHALYPHTKHYGIYDLPFETVYIGLYVNTRIMSDNHIKIPKTIEELHKAVEKLNRSNITPIAYSVGYEGSLLYQSLVSSLSCNSGSCILGADFSQVYVDAMKAMRELYSLNAFPQNSFILNGYEQNKLFLSGKAAMMVQGSWFTGYLSEMEDPVEIVHFPVNTGTKPSEYHMIGQNGYGAFHVSSRVMEDPQRAEAIKKFLQYFTSKDVALKFIAEKGMISALNLDESVYETNHYAFKGKQLMKNSDTFYYFPSEYFGNQIWDEFFVNEFPYMLESRTTPEDLFYQATKRLPKK